MDRFHTQSVRRPAYIWTVEKIDNVDILGPYCVES